MSYLPRFQAQNPAISGYSLGWASCTAFSGAMAADFDTLGAKRPTGAQVRLLTRDTSGGLNLQQVDAALLQGWDINLNTSLGISWTDFAKKIDAGCGAILQGRYSAIADSRFDAGRGFRGGHAIFVAPGWVGMDPLADGRAPGVYKYRGEAYPQSLLRTFAGHLDLGGRELGLGLAYASFTRDNVHTYHLAFLGGAAFWVYRVSNGVIVSRRSVRLRKASGAPCSAPKLYRWPGKASRNLVKVTAGLFAGEYISIPQSSIRLELVP
jgi:hypothetical protein